MLSVQVVETIDRHTDVTYSVAAAQAGGLISPRDFVCVRQWVKRDGNMVIAGVCLCLCLSACLSVSLSVTNTQASAFRCFSGESLVCLSVCDVSAFP